MAGEYGEKFSRPHFHACLFGFDFSDKKYLCKSPGGFKLYRSAVLESLWPHGFSSVGSVTFESAAYVARYIMKKVTGGLADEHYSSVDPDTGEVIKREPEFCHMSLKPGIGAGWFDKFSSDVYPNGRVVVRGVECKPPRYYDKRFNSVDFEKFDDLQFGRHIEAVSRAADNTDARLLVKEQVAQARISLLKRSL